MAELQNKSGTQSFCSKEIIVFADKITAKTVPLAVISPRIKRVNS